jgi:hypothetical protein
MNKKIFLIVICLISLYDSKFSIAVAQNNTHTSPSINLPNNILTGVADSSIHEPQMVAIFTLEGKMIFMNPLLIDENIGLKIKNILIDQPIGIYIGVLKNRRFKILNR